MSGILAIGLAACSTARMQSGLAFNDDIYYNPKGQPLMVSDQYIPVIADQSVKSQDNKVYDQKVREYNRTSYGNDPRDFSQIQSNYAAILADESVQNVDTVVYYNDETGYWVNGFSGSSYDQDYAERLIRFHGPFRGIPYYSPLYTQVVYFSDPDWNVYVDGNYAYAFPSWSNPYYSNFYYGGYRPGWNWSMGWGLGYGYGYGWPYYGWYGGWNYPYYGWGWGFGFDSYWGLGYHGYWGHPWWHHHHHHHYYPGGNVAHRPGREVYYGSRTGNTSTAVGNFNSSNSYRTSTRSDYKPASVDNRQSMSVTRDGVTTTTTGRVSYTRSGSSATTNNKGATTVVGAGSSSGQSQQNSVGTAVRDRGQRNGTTVTQRYNSGQSSTTPQGSNSRPSYTPSNTQRNVNVERNSGAVRSSGYTPSNNSYTPSRSSGSSNSSGGSYQRSNRR